jgi:hypothetical protein
MSNLEELRTAYREASGRYETIRDERMRREREEQDKVREKIRSLFGDNETAASVALAGAENAFHAEEDRLRVLGNSTKLPHPEGTVLVEWKAGRYYADKTLRPARKAVLQIYREGDPLPANVKWHRPQVGEIILRLLKKDGTPSSAIEQIHSRGDWFVNDAGGRYHWLRVGVEPKQ